MSELLALALALAAIASVLVVTLRTGVPPTPASPRVRRAVVAALPRGLDGTVYELGAGWGGLALALARSQPGARVVACEVSPLPWLVARARALAARPPRPEVRLADAFALPLGDAAAVVAYLGPEATARLKEKLAAELPAGALVVSATFALRGWRPLRVLDAEDMYATPVYVYRMRDSLPATEESP